MIYRLHGLSTKNTSIGILQSVPLPPVRGPQAVVQREPGKEFDPRWRPSLPELLCPEQRGQAGKESSVGRGSRVLAILGPLPDESIRLQWVQRDSPSELPNL